MRRGVSLRPSKCSVTPRATAVMNASLIVPAARRPATRRVSRGSEKNRRSSPSERAAGTAGSGAPGRIIRTAAPIASPSPRLAAVASGRVRVATACSSAAQMPPSAADTSPLADAVAAGERSGGRGGGGSDGNARGASTSMSNSSSISSTPPIPSLTAWCDFRSSASPPASPVRCVNSQSGRPRSNGCTIRSRATSTRRASSPPARSSVRR